jgi:hypothetical protein
MARRGVIYFGDSIKELDSVLSVSSFGIFVNWRIIGRHRSGDVCQFRMAPLSTKQLH